MTEPTNRMPSLYPVIGYRDVPAAIALFKEAFGFEEWLVVPGPEGGVMHAELALGDGIVMLHSLRADQPEARRDNYSFYVVVEDLDAHFAHAKSAGARVTKKPFGTDCGSRGYSAVNPPGLYMEFRYLSAQPAGALS